MNRFVMAAALVLASLGHARAGFIANGSFESPDIPYLSARAYFVGDTSLTGWTISGPSGNSVTLEDFNGIAFGGHTTPYGAQWLWLGGLDSHPTISQTVSGLTVGATYELSFAISSEYSVYRDGAVVTINQGGTSATQTFVDTSTPVVGLSWNSWSTQTWQFVATTTSATISFTGMTGAYDVGLDNVDLTEVQGPVSAPAPPGLLLALTGAASLGGFGWLRQRKLAATA